MLKRFCLVAMLLGATLSQASAVSFLFDYTYDSSNFFTPERRNTLNAAGLWLGSRLEDNLAPIAPSGMYTWAASFYHPSADELVVLDDLTISEDTILIFVGAADLADFTLAEGGPGGYSVGGSDQFREAVMVRGQAGGSLNPPTDFGTWGGTITFNSEEDWYADQDPATFEPFAEYDLFSVALHEIAHVLGFGLAESFTELLGNDDTVFTGTDATSVYGSNPPLSASLHLQEGLQSFIFGTSVLQEAAMDPTIGAGFRKHMTDLDMAVLSDFGWEVVPEPSTAALLALGALPLFAGRRRSARTK